MRVPISAVLLVSAILIAGGARDGDVSITRFLTVAGLVAAFMVVVYWPEVKKVTNEKFVNRDVHRVRW